MAGSARNEKVIWYLLTSALDSWTATHSGLVMVLSIWVTLRNQNRPSIKSRKKNKAVTNSRFRSQCATCEEYLVFEQTLVGIDAIILAAWPHHQWAAKSRNQLIKTYQITISGTYCHWRSTPKIPMDWPGAISLFLGTDDKLFSNGRLILNFSGPIIYLWNKCREILNTCILKLVCLGSLTYPLFPRLHNIICL